MTRRLPGFVTVFQRSSMMIALALLALQAFIVQTHVHAAPLQPSVALANGHTAQLPDAQPTCPICEDLALFGHYVPPVPVTLALSATVAFWFQPRAGIADAPRAISHRWRSRAPPSLFQA